MEIRRACVAHALRVWVQQRRGLAVEQAPTQTVQKATFLDEKSWEEGAFRKVASHTLEELLDAVEEPAEECVGSEFDAELSGDVLNLRLGAVRGTYVFNLQTPNRQIWMSSPVSGPWRFHYNPERCQWYSTRDGQSLGDKVGAELHQLIGVRISFPS
ncbi:Frataxin, mitochondrial [Porphyridium purpureum]|uniref:Frataxin, mitochondrial n=1 Tax=Porphyridium purpureum TaxID=35688 RepID=A0A5J4ZB50_PORPP|nr:Frataxin, mitochondrial [Porphyridium purpureum]|eukprot:POR7570..scf295_1